MPDLPAIRAENTMRAAGHAYVTARRAIEASLRDLDDDSLVAVMHRARSLTETNCWWAEYDAGPMVLEAARDEQGRRQRAAEEAADG